MLNKMNTKKNITYFNDFLNKLRLALNQPLPGTIAQSMMAPPHRPVGYRIPKNRDAVRNSAVLILLWLDDDQISTVFILRPEYDGIHSNQIAFPGGKHEKTDVDFVATALREAHEEVGIIPETISILGTLSPLYIPPSQFMVYPVVGFIERKPAFILDPVEIKKVIPCNLLDFLRPESYVISDIEVNGKTLPDIPCFKIDDSLMWGATAMIFNEFLEIIKHFD
jgi:8-oxo-dGTP pyrophosphatase MutT (NUDIX family)